MSSLEAKDTVMRQETIHEKYFNNTMPWPAISARYVAQAQAEITGKVMYDEGFKAGMNVVADWIEKDRYDINQKNVPELGIIPISLIHLERWQAFLKEKGIK